MSQVVGLSNSSFKPITNTAWVRPRLCKLQKGCTRLAAASDKAYQLLVHGRWFYPGTPASSTTKTGRHYIAEILLKGALNTKNKINQSYQVARLSSYFDIRVYTFVQSWFLNIINNFFLHFIKKQIACKDTTFVSSNLLYV